MTDNRGLATKPDTSTVAGVTVLRALRSLVLFASGAALLYAIVSTASRGVCRGGITSGGGFIDADGRATDVAPRCIELALRPSVFVFLAFAGIVLWAFDAIIRRATDQAEALRFVRRAMIWTGAVLVASLVISQVWFALIPVGDWDGVNTGYLFPFPFGSVSLEITPMRG